MSDEPNNIVKLLTALLAPAQDAESAMQQLFVERAVDTAVGVQLDMLGRIVGQPRLGLEDDDYRRMVRARVSVNNSESLIIDLITVAGLFVNDDDADIIIDNQGAAAVVTRIEGVPVAYAEYPSTFQDANRFFDGGTWTALYPCTLDGDGYLLASLGTKMTEVNATLTNQPGPLSQYDRSVGFTTGIYDNSAWSLASGDFDHVGATDDLIIACVLRQETLVGVQTSRIFSNVNGGAGFYVECDKATDLLHITVSDGADTATASIASDQLLSDEWQVLIAVLDRSTDKLRIGIRSLVDGTEVLSTEVDTAAVGDMTNAEPFYLGSGTRSSKLSVAFMAWGIGSGAATGASTGLSDMLEEAATRITQGLARDLLISLLRDTVAGGVRAILESSAEPVSTWFIWDTDDQGWDDGQFLSAVD